FGSVQKFGSDWFPMSTAQKSENHKPAPPALPGWRRMTGHARKTRANPRNPGKGLRAATAGGPDRRVRDDRFLELRLPRKRRGLCERLRRVKARGWRAAQQALGRFKGETCQVDAAERIVPAACAERLKDIAGTVKNEFDEDLTAALEKRNAEAKG